MTTRSMKVREHNDLLRRDHSTGRVLITEDVSNLGAEAVARILEKVAAYDAFDKGNDPYDEGDFGIIHENGETFFWKIDSYDKALSMHSPDAADPAVTERVLTVMKSSNY